MPRDTISVRKANLKHRSGDLVGEFKLLGVIPYSLGERISSVVKRAGDLPTRHISKEQSLFAVSVAQRTGQANPYDEGFGGKHLI